MSPGTPMLNACGAFSADGGDEHRRQADQRVERRDQLRQRRHLDPQRDHGADAAADQDAEQDQQVTPAVHAVLQHGRDHGDGHADHAEAVARPRGDRGRQAAQRQDEQDGGDEVSEGRQAGGHRYCFFLNIESMRCVTMKPPKIFTDAKVTAMKPNSIAHERRGQAGCQHRADDDHRGNRVGHRHQRRVQRRGHVPHDVVADEAGHQENGEQEDERIDLGRHGLGHAHRQGLGVVGQFQRVFGEAGRFIRQLVGVHLGRVSGRSGGLLGQEIRVDDGAAAGQHDAFHDVIRLRQF